MGYLEAVKNKVFASEQDKNEKYNIGENPQDDLKELLKEIKKHKKKIDEKKIHKAFSMCIHAHRNKLRKSGDPFYTHPLNTARILINEIPLDENAIIGALLHEVIETGEFTYNGIKSEFGTSVAEIVEGVSKIEHIESHHMNHINQLENYRKLLISMLKDVRIILIKLADRLHNMRTLEFLSKESQIKFAKETFEVYAPFANRFGLRDIKWELEDLAFKFLDPNNFYEIKGKLKSTREEREIYIEELLNPIKEKLQQDQFLKKNKIKYELKGRPKHIYSIYNKMLARGKPMEELYDLHAFRIILDTNDPFICFYVYGIIASIYKPIPETFKDYISAPKKNGYQSIHTGLIGKNNIAVELQIRTRKMHEFAEKGVAAHFKYKDNIESQTILETKDIDLWISEVREILENIGDNTSEQVLENVKNHLLVDEIYVFSPSNEYITLPRASTPLDYAFHIHSDLGYKFIGAKVNGKIVPFDYKLQSGDQIDILTSEHHDPNEEWLKVCMTTKAKNSILKYIKEKRKSIEEKGKLIWENKVKERGFNLTQDDFRQLVKSLKFDSNENFYYALGSENVDLNKVYMYIKMKIRDGFKIPHNTIKKEIAFAQDDSDGNLKSAKGIINKQYNNIYEYNKMVKKSMPAKIEMKIIALNSPTVIIDINNILMEEDDIEVLGVNFDSGEKNITGTVKLKISSNVILDTISNRMKTIHGVHSVEIE